MVPLTLLGVAASLVNETVAAGLFQLADYAVAVFWFALIKIESGGWFPVLSLNASAPVVLFASFGVALLLIPRGSGLRPLSIVLLLPLLSVSERDMSPGIYASMHSMSGRDYRLLCRRSIRPWYTTPGAVLRYV